MVKACAYSCHQCNPGIGGFGEFGVDRYNDPLHLKDDDRLHFKLSRFDHHLDRLELGVQ